jgi:Heavy-metal resistance
MRNTLFVVPAAMLALSPTLTRAQAQPPAPPQDDREQTFNVPVPGPRGLHGPGRLHAGIPPRIAARIGVPQELQTRIQQMAFQSNEQLINLEADLKRAQLELEKLLASQKPDSNAVMTQVDRVSRAEAEVRKNRLGLMLRIREALGAELWQKLQAEMPMHRGMRIKKFRGGAHGPFGQLDAPDEVDEIEIER